MIEFPKFIAENPAIFADILIVIRLKYTIESLFTRIKQLTKNKITLLELYLICRFPNLYFIRNCIFNHKIQGINHKIPITFVNKKYKIAVLISLMIMNYDFVNTYDLPNNSYISYNLNQMLILHKNKYHYMNFINDIDYDLFLNSSYINICTKIKNEISYIYHHIINKSMKIICRRLLLLNPNRREILYNYELKYKKMRDLDKYMSKPRIIENLTKNELIIYENNTILYNKQQKEISEVLSKM